MSFLFLSLTPDTAEIFKVVRLKLRKLEISSFDSKVSTVPKLFPTKRLIPADADLELRLGASQDTSPCSLKNLQGTRTSSSALACVSDSTLLYFTVFLRWSQKGCIFTKASIRCFQWYERFGRTPGHTWRSIYGKSTHGARFITGGAKHSSRRLHGQWKPCRVARNPFRAPGLELQPQATSYIFPEVIPRRRGLGATAWFARFFAFG